MEMEGAANDNKKERPTSLDTRRVKERSLTLQETAEFSQHFKKVIDAYFAGERSDEMRAKMHAGIDELCKTPGKESVLHAVIWIRSYASREAKNVIQKKFVSCMTQLARELEAKNKMSAEQFLEFTNGSLDDLNSKRTVHTKKAVRSTLPERVVRLDDYRAEDRDTALAENVIHLKWQLNYIVDTYFTTPATTPDGRLMHEAIEKVAPSSIQVSTIQALKEIVEYAEQAKSQLVGTKKELAFISRITMLILDLGRVKNLSGGDFFSVSQRMLRPLVKPTRLHQSVLRS